MNWVNFKKHNILVVDDDEGLRMSVRDILEKHGAQVFEAEGGMAALESARENPPDLILLDVIMPGVDGYDTCDNLKSIDATKDVPIVFMTGIDEIDHKMRAFSVGGVDYITKPYQINELLARVNVHLELADLRRELDEKNQILERTLETGSAVNVAIGLLMGRDGVERDDAYELIFSKARETRTKIKDVADQIILAR